LVGARHVTKHKSKRASEQTKTPERSFGGIRKCATKNREIVATKNRDFDKFCDYHEIVAVNGASPPLVDPV
jgi:hypothetical protein